jgi:hypothetical protein
MSRITGWKLGVLLLIGVGLGWFFGQTPPPLEPPPVDSLPVVTERPQPTDIPQSLPPESLEVLELFAPDSAMLTRQHSATAMRQSVEEALTVTFLLTRCGLLTQQQYSDSYNGFATFLVESDLATDLSDAAAKMQQLGRSATASYQLVYGRVPCSDPSLPRTRDSLLRWLANRYASP